MFAQGRPINKLARQMALQTAAVAFALAVIVSLYAVGNRVSSLTAEHIDIRNGLIAATLPAFNLATFNYNTRLNQHLAEGLAQHPQIGSVVVLDSDGSIQARASSSLECQPGSADIILFGEPAIEVTQLTYAGTHLGKLVVEDDLCGVISVFYQSVWSTVTYILLMTAAVAIFVFTAFYRRVTRPLSHLSQQISSLSAENIEHADLSALRTHRTDELGHLISGTRKLLEILKDHIARGHKAESTISEYSAKLETLIHKRSDALAGMRRKLSSGVEDERQAQIPLLSVLLPQAQELLTRIAGELTTDDQQQTLRLLQLLEKLSIIEQPEQTSVISLSAVIRDILAMCPAKISVRLEAGDRIIAASGRLALMLENIACIAAHSGFDNLTLTFKRQNDLLDIGLTGPEFSLPCNTLNTVIDNDLRLAPGTLSAITRAMGGRMEIDQSGQNGLRLMVQVPVQWLSDKLSLIREHLRHTAVHLAFSNEILQLQIQRWLEEWEIPVSTDKAESSASLTLSDINTPGTGKGTRLVLQTTGDRAYKQIDFLRDLLQLIPGNKPHNHAPQVLLVDDNTINRMLCQRFLRNLGITPDAVDNGLQALEQAQHKRYDLILMDCQMPVMDGIESTRQIRRHSMNMKTPIIALTGLTGENERQQCLTAGMNDFISKPFTQDQIQAVLIQWLENYQLMTQGPASAE